MGLALSETPKAGFIASSIWVRKMTLFGCFISRIQDLYIIIISAQSWRIWCQFRDLRLV